MSFGPSGQIDYSYPPRARIDILDCEIDAQAESIGRRIGGWEEILPGISSCVMAFAASPLSGSYQALGWLRLAAAFRRRAIEEDPQACDALAALSFLNRCQKFWNAQETQKELNWVLDRALDRLGMGFEGGWIYNAITEAEMHAIQERLQSVPDSGKASSCEVIEAISAQVETIRGSAVLTAITGFDQKLDALIEAANDYGPVAEVARSALRYLADVDDVIPDDAGILGLLDDLYVIEWAYAKVEQQAYGLPLLSNFQKRSPHLESSYLTAKNAMLDRFGQYVVGNAQFVLEGNGTDHIVLRDAEAYLAPVVGSVALTAMRDSAEADANARWKKGTILNLLRVGRSPERVRYLGHETIEGDERIIVEVRSSGRLYLPARLACSMEVSPRQDYKTLSNGAAVSAWQKSLSVDPLHFLLRGRPRSDTRRAVLVIAPRNLLEHYLPSLYCRGEPISRVIGSTWISASEHEEPLSHSVITRAMIYACGSAMVARSLIDDAPSGVSAFDVIAFGTQAYREIKAEYVGREAPGMRILCLADISEFPAPPRDALIMEDDVVLPWSLRPRGYRQTDPLARALTRQYNHWIVDRRVRLFANQPLAEICNYLEHHSESAEGEFSPVVPQLRSFLFDAGKMPRRCGSYQQNLRSRAEALARATKLEALYDQSLVAVSQGLRELAVSAEFTPDILENCASEISQPVTVLCRSHQEAQETTRFLQHRGLKGAGLTPAELFRIAPVEHLIVPGWHGADTMRRLDSSIPAAKLDYLLFDFQKGWFDRVTGAVRNRVKSFNSPIRQLMKGQQPHHLETMIWPLPESPIAPNIEDTTEYVPTVELSPELDGIVDGIRQHATANEEAKVNGIPVILDDYENYMFLPAHADLVLLNRDAKCPEDTCISVTQLREGDIFIMRDGSHRELFQELALNFLQDPHAVLKASNLWREPLKSAYEAGSATWSDFRKRLARAGLQRTETAYRNWINGQTIAPLNYRDVIPTICSLSSDPIVRKSGEAVVGAVTALYEARHKAAARIFEELIKGTANHAAGTLQITLGSTSVVLNTHRVDYVGKASACARSFLWQRQRLERKTTATNL